MHNDSADIIVVGAGPAGSTAAADLAAAGFDVLVLEEHREPGLPVHCTGIVGEEIFDAFDLPRDLILNPLRRFRVFAPGGERHFDLGARAGTRSAAYVLDRQALDRHLAQRAARSGARFACSTKVRQVDAERDLVRVQVTVDGEPGEITGRLCVLACGAMSNLPARSGIVPPRAFHRTVQATWSIPDLADAEIFLGRRVAPGSFGYAVSLGNGAAKVGIINRSTARPGYRRIVEQVLAGRAQRPLTREVYRRIPMGACRRSVVGRVMAVGDAAGQSKTTTGGGIYYAMLCARMLGRTVVEARRGGDLAVGALARYEREWRRRLGLEIQAGLWMRGLAEHVGDDEVARLVGLADSAPVRDLIGREWSFDYHRRLLLGLVRLPELRGSLLGLAAERMRARRLFDFIVSVVEGRVLGAVAEAPPP